MPAATSAKNQINTLSLRRLRVSVVTQQAYAVTVEPVTDDRRARIRGSLLAGAIGDALGAPIEFMSLAEIRTQYGAAGITGYLPAYGRHGGAITDDTQLTLFTAEGLLRALTRDSHYGIVDAPGVVLRSYWRWLATQGETWPDSSMTGAAKDGWLSKVPDLNHRRAPGNTCLAALRGGGRGTIEQPTNRSKGCGAVMRSAPFGLVGMRSPQPFDLAVQCAVLTHGHPSGYLTAGVLAATISAILDDVSLDAALDQATSLLRGYPGHEETLRAVEAARQLGEHGDPTPEKIEQLGAGWVAEEALAISIYCALTATDLHEALLLAVNHSGDSDSTGSITGNIVGAIAGEAALPADLLAGLELADVITRIADDLTAGFYEGAAGGEYLPMTPEIEDFIRRYPGA
jgi:ADP-ribosylglycohydrolase